ncbi:MAG: divergent polysaccharide deacetylase family protein [Dinoroseobacter sp.]|nr:divergent polysaccharide deacetylase family protein [Dinoroseobacter sp.]
MGRGLLSGLFWGGVASMVVLIIVSLYYPMRSLVNQSAEPETERTAPIPDVASEGRPILSDPPAPAPGAELADTPPAVPAPSAQPDSAPDLAVRPEDTTEEALVDGTGPARPELSDTRQAAPSGPAPAAPTVTPETAPAPESLANAPVTPDADVPMAPTAAPPPPELAAAPSVILPAPLAEDVPQSEGAPSPAALPTPDAADAIAAPLRPAAIPEAQVPLVALPAPLPNLPERPGGPVPPRGVGSAPAPDTARIAMPALIGETPMPDTLSAQAGAEPSGVRLPPFAGAPEQTPPAQPDLQLSALTRPITEGPPVPQPSPAPMQSEQPEQDEPADPAPQAVPETPPEPSAEAAPDAAPERPEPGFAVTQPNEAAPEDPIARLQPAQPEQAAPQRTLPRRIVVGGDGPRDGVARLSARFGGSNRLPQIGSTPAATPPADAPVGEAAPEGAGGAPLGALERNAQPWEGAAPLTSIVLQATGPDRAVFDSLAGIAAPLTVALDPSWPDVADRATAMREAGHEVLITLTGLPPRPEPRDIDVALNAHVARLPQAVGVYLPLDSPIGTDRELLSHLAARLTQTGHGLVAEARGLNAMAQIARAEGTALAAVDDVLAPQLLGPLAARALDRAVFEAAREGRFVLLGQTQPDTLTALQNWTREADESLAPISAILLDDS